MNRFLNTIAITTTLILIQSCSLLIRDEGKLISAATNQHEEHSIGEINHREHSTSGTGDGTKAFTQVKLKVPNILTPNKNIPIVIGVQDSDGKAIANFDTFQEKLMHLILVSDDLQFFSHLHPTYKENGQFEVAARFPQAGNYTFFSDYKPAVKQNKSQC